MIFGLMLPVSASAISTAAGGTASEGMLSLLAFLQWKSQSPPLLGLASWIGGILGPATETYHNRNTRSEIEREIPRLVRRGSLPEMFDLIDNAERRREDQNGFAEAQAAYAEIKGEIDEIEGSDSERTAKALSLIHI